MENKHVIELLPEYLDKTLVKDLIEKVENHLNECEACNKERKDLQQLLKAFENETLEWSSNSLRNEFFDKIEREKTISLDEVGIQKSNNWVNNFLKIAASVALLVGSYSIGKQQQEEVSNVEIAQLTDETKAFKQTAMLSLMGNKSASKRIQGVNFIEEFSEPDETIVMGLADRMLNDENTNVRRTAVEVLSEFTASDTVKTTFVKALKTEKDPGIQITLIQVLGKMQEKKAAAAMQYLFDQEDTQPYVKEELELVLPNII